MTGTEASAAVIACLLLVYLLVALFKPEWFS